MAVEKKRKPACTICGLELFTKTEKNKKICATCTRRGYKFPLLNKRVLIIPEMRAGVVRFVDTTTQKVLVEFVGGRKSKEPLRVRTNETQPSWEKQDWFNLYDLRLWTKKRVRRFKTDKKQWRLEPMP